MPSMARRRRWPTLGGPHEPRQRERSCEGHPHGGAGSSLRRCEGPLSSARGGRAAAAPGSDSATLEHRSRKLSRFHRLFKVWNSYDTISKFEDLDEHFASLGTGMTHYNKFRDR
jgi:hypothetical protein